MKFKSGQLLLLFFVLNSTQLLGQMNEISFRQISPPGGFTLKAITSFAQDNLGYIWIGTKQGLIKYDSENTSWFIPSSKDSLSLQGEFVNNIYIDKNYNVWVSTNEGLCVFDRQTQGFKTIKYTYDDGSICTTGSNEVFEIGNGKLFILDAEYCGIFDSTKKQLTRIAPNTIKSPVKIYRDNYNRIWIGTLSGEIYRYYQNSNEVQKIISGNNTSVNTIYAENDRIWVGLQSNGVKIYKLNGELITPYYLYDSQGNKLKNTNIRLIKKDTYGRMWFAAYEGLFMDDGKQLKNFAPDDYPNLPHNSIYEIFEDRQGGIWIGTWSGGVALIHHSNNNFQTYRHSTFSNSLSNNNVSSFLQINKKELLIGTEVGGLNLLNLETNIFENIQFSDKVDVINIKSLCKDKYGGIWIGTFKNGLWYRPQLGDKFKLFDQGTEDGQHISSPSVYSLCAVDSGVWIGVFGSSVNFYDFKSKSIRFCFKNNSNVIPMSTLPTQTILADSNSNLWIGTLKGLFKVHLPTTEIRRIKIGSGNDQIYYLWKQSSKDIWIGTKNSGIIIFHPETNDFEYFNADGLLEGKDVYGIIEDENNQIWITSNNGLIVHNTKTIINRHFVYSDGIQGNLFSPQAIYKDDKNKLYFGGTNGFTIINPAQLKTNSKKPFTIINEILTQNDKVIYPTYSKNLEIKLITLNPEENTFRINFSADNYLMPEKNKYRYRLINYYDEWIDNQNDGTALFTSLGAGEYIFEVKACNNDGVWSDSPTQMRIIINNYWYKTKLAYICYFLVFSAFLYFIIRFYFERIKLKRAVLLEKNQRENEEQIHEMKLKFFTNISHEFRTPLTLISWPLKRLLNADNITNEQREELEVVTRNSNRLLQLINQIVDLRKLEKGKSKLNISKIDLIQFITEMQQGFSSETKSKEINFVLESPYSSLEIEADREKLDTIIYNLLSNAYKYVSEKGRIRISVNKELSNDSKSYTNQLSFGEIRNDDFVEISVEDSGSGIDSEDLLTIFNRFEQGKQSDNKKAKEVRGSGIGLSLCKEYTLLHQGIITAQSNSGGGSRFTILLPTKQKAQKILFESHQEFKNLKGNETLTIKTKAEQEPDTLIQILIVEDNNDFRKFIGNFLNKYYQVLFATNGEEALSILKKQNIDLVLSDVMMPKMDGFEFCSILKTQIETSHIPVILLTALSSSENLIAGLDKGADAYLTKPFDENVLLKQIENIMEQRKRLRQNFSKQFISQKTVEVGSLDNFFLNRVRTVVEKNISDENFGIENLAEELMISRSQLHRKIKSLSGSTTSDFVNLVRIKKAVELTEHGNFLFNEVAYQVGFNSQSYFNKCFKKIYGVTPNEYFGRR